LKRESAARYFVVATPARITTQRPPTEPPDAVQNATWARKIVGGRVDDGYQPGRQFNGTDVFYYLAAIVASVGDSNENFGFFRTICNAMLCRCERKGKCQLCYGSCKNITGLERPSVVVKSEKTKNMQINQIVAKTVTGGRLHVLALGPCD
jgi:hypothetical protein